MTTPTFSLIRTYTAKSTTGFVYELDGRRCASLARDLDSLKARLGVSDGVTVEQLVALGGREWRKGDKHRVYFNNIAPLIGLSLSRYGTGNISSARLDGRKISNSSARRILNSISRAKFWYDLADGDFHSPGPGRRLF